MQQTSGEKLAALLSEGLRDGELTSDLRPREERAEPEPDPAQNAMRQAISARIAASEAARIVGAGSPDQNGGLCALLGYRRVVDKQPAVGADVTQGLCAGMRADELSATFTTRLPGGKTEGRTDSGVVSAAVGESRARATVTETRTTVEVQRPARSDRAATTRSAVDKSARDLADMIPAGARYVLIGSFADEGGYGQTRLRLTAMGYATGRGRDGGQGRLLLAGPFDDREQVVRALHHLRQNGYPGAVAR
ncbi:SPOR domain-containing protein [Paracoccus caeni]|uniref:SPOR domain-containing protein n=1 Tax=Paracoccus caeni TaxID=657651 RepID=A0A934VZ93_9RHOB|nr:SPOR domain-containing protein [Paracoccus caeni]